MYGSLAHPDSRIVYAEYFYYSFYYSFETLRVGYFRKLMAWLMEKDATLFSISALTLVSMLVDM